MEQLEVGQRVSVVEDKHIPGFIGKPGTVEEVLPDGSGMVRFRGDETAKWRYRPAALRKGWR